MELSARRQPPTVRLRRLAAELRRLRTEADLTREEVSEQTSINPATLYRIETARVRPQRRTLMAMLDTYGITDEDQRGELIALSQQATQLGWLQTYESELPELYTTYISFETEARSVHNYESLFVPGLLQTQDYARAVIKAGLPLATEEDIHARIEARIRRQESLRKKDSIRLWTIVDEAVLHRQVGSAKVTAEQLEVLAEAATQPHITLQVIPFDSGAHAGMPGSFVIMDFPNPADPALVYIDSMAGDLFLEHEADVRRFTTTFEYLQATALDPTSSIKAIEAQIHKIKEKGGAG